MFVSPSYPSSIGTRDKKGGTSIPSNTSLPFPFRFFLAFEDGTEEFGGGLGGLGSGGTPLFNKERVSGQAEIIFLPECIITRTDERLRLTGLLNSSSGIIVDVVATGPSVFQLSVTKVNIQVQSVYLCPCPAVFSYSHRAVVCHLRHS